MAVNKKGGPVNHLGDEDFGLSEIARIGQSWNRTSVAERELRQRASLARSELQTADLLESHTNRIPEANRADWEKDISRLRSKAEKTINGVEPRIRSGLEAKRERLNEQAVNAVYRGSSESSINGYVASAMNSSSNQIAAMGMSKMSWDQLNSGKESTMAQIAAIRAQNMKLAGSFIGGHGVNAGVADKLVNNNQQLQSLTSSLIPYSIALKQQRALGMDPESRQRALLGTGQYAEGILRQRGIESDIRGGTGLGALTGVQLKQKETEVAQKLVTALEKLSDQTNKTQDDLKKLNEEAEGAAKELKDIGEFRKGGGARPPDGSRTFQVVAGGIASLALTGANAVQQMGINNPMAQMANIGGYANIENQKYDMYRSAAAGDIASQMLLPGWNDAMKFGRNRATAAGWVTGLRTGAGVLTTAAGVAQTTEAIKGAASPVEELFSSQHATQIMQGIGTTAEGVALTATSAQDGLTHVSTSGAEIAGINASMEAQRQVIQIPAYQAQAYRNHIVGMGGVARGMGARAGGFVGEVGGAGFLSQMSAVGLGSNEAIGLAGAGMSGMGSMFGSSSILAAKGLENLGSGSAMEQMQRMASLSSGGSNNPQAALVSIIETGMSKGSK
jgi:hypothetical protein